MARAIRRAAKAAVSPQEAVAKEAEELAKHRFNYDVDGMEYLTHVDGQLVVNIAKMIRDQLTK